MNRRRQSWSSRSQRGSVLMVALILSAVLALTLTSYMRLGTQTLSLSNRALYYNAATNLAETGLEEALWSLNQTVAGNTSAWSDWSVDGGSKVGTRNVKNFDLGQNAIGNVRIFVSNTSSNSTPFIVARATVTPPAGNVIEKWIKVTLTTRSLFANGLVAKDSISFSGNAASVDSYDSSKGAYNASLGGGKTNKNDNGSAGSTSIVADIFSLGNADIWGFAAVGSSDTSGLSVGSNGTVGAFGTASGTVDASHVITNFTANFSDVTAPTTTGYTLGAISGATALPRATDTAAADGKYYYTVTSIGLAGAATNVLSIGTTTTSANVVIIMVPGVGTTISLTGNASIMVNQAGATSSTLNVYTYNDVSIAGNGVVNTSDPSNIMIWGTRAQSETSTQTIKIAGNGNLSAVVYAPNGDIQIKGGGASGGVFGAALGKTVSLTGNDAFHYDEHLSSLNANTPFGISKWDELTAATDRTTYTASLSF
jgi:hypothetical protein